MEIVSRSPQRPNDIVAEREEVDAHGVARALERGRTAQREWARLPATTRALVLGRAGDQVASASTDLAELGIREVGKPRGEMLGEVARAVALLRYYAQQVLDPDGTVLPSPDGRSLLYTRRRPHGVAGLITPWNFPLAIPLWKAAPALAFGNAVVLKPAPHALGVALALEELMSRELPDGLFQVIAGDKEAGSALAETADVVSFTGSQAVGRSVVATAAGRGHAVQAEMGGQNPSIVFPDADLDAAATAVALAAMGYAGQKCTATSRVIVVGDPGRFTDALRDAIERLPIGEPSELDTVIGPVIDERARTAVLGAAAEAVTNGARLVTGATAPDRDGYFVRPTLLDHVDAEMRVSREEVFGPIATITAVASEEEAFAAANAVRYGLVAAVFTTDLDRALASSERLGVGLVKINAPTTGVDFFAPFGGIKDSSFGGREQGKAAQDFYTWTQTVTTSPARAL
jgi:aldehyde dehydrogenase (NAD+)